MARWVVPGLALVLVCAAAAVPVGVGATLQGDPGTLQGDPGTLQGNPGTLQGDRAALPVLGAIQGEFDSTEFEITVYGNGSARWTFKYKKRLNETERETFEDFAASFNNRSSPELFANFRRRAESLTRQGTNVTGRTMEARNFYKRAYVDEQLGGPQGIVKMSFTWTSFAASQGDSVVVGDVFEDGLYIADDQQLLFHPGPDMVFDVVKPDTYKTTGASLRGSDTVYWEGPQDFQVGPIVEYVPKSAAGDGTSTSSGSTLPGGGNLGMLPWIALGVVVLVALGGAFAYRSGSLPGPGNSGATSQGGTGGAGSSSGGASGTATTDGSAEPAVPDEELLSDEDRVLQLLDDSGGRMKQVNIVDETGWSKSKVSMLLSEMEDDEYISKLRVGRENIISLKGEEPEAAGSPFERESEN